MAADVHEVIEVLDLLEKLGATVNDVMADGKVNVLDLPKLASLWTPAKAALDGIQNVVPELEKLDSAAVQSILVKMVSVGQVWMSVFVKTSKA